MRVISETYERSAALSVKPFLPRALSGHPLLVRLLDAALGLTQLSADYRRLPVTDDPRVFAANALGALGVGMEVNPADVRTIPASGPCLVVANHPHGGLDGLLMIELLLGVRSDVKILANYFLSQIAELRSLFFEVDPFGGPLARRHNVQAVRAAHRWLNNGGMVLMFPGGEVSSFNVSARQVLDPPWQNGAASLLRRSRATVLPIHIGGRNSFLFQLGGLLDPRLRTLLLVREMFKQRQHRVELRVGRPIQHDDLMTLGSDESIMNYLRARTYLLPQAKSRPPRPYDTNGMPPVSAALDRAAQQAEVGRLPDTQRLLESGKFAVYFAGASQLPTLLPEIGRLRELSFRAVGEGTGRAVDLDRHDDYYTHLFVWDREEEGLVGAYRIGHTAEILDQYGPGGLYVSSLFRLSPRLLTHLRQGLELGRSFVRQDYQRSFSALLMLWKGIAAYVVRHPEHRYLYGPVSISNSYHPMSQRILIQFLARHYLSDEFGAQVRPLRPPRSFRRAEQIVDTLDDPESPLLDDLLRAIETDGKGMPVLLRQYLKLGGRILGFSVDPAFQHVVDCLLLVDLQTASRDVLEKYMGTEAAQAYLAGWSSPQLAAA